MEFKILWGAVCLLLLLFGPVTGFAAGENRLPGVSEPMAHAEYWVGRIQAPHQVMLTPTEITAFNHAISAAMPQAIVEMDRFPDAIDRNTLQRWLAADRLPRGQERYSAGELVSNSFYDQVAQNMNLKSLRDMNPVEWGFTVGRTDLRTFPTATASSEDDESDDFDLFQETAVNIAEPVAVLHRSGDGTWFYVQTYNYRGWVRATDVALAPSRQTWKEKREAASFLIITGTKVVPRETVMGHPAPAWRAGMGTRIPFLGMEQGGYAVEVPQRDSNGKLSWRKAWIHGKADVSVGYLSYTRAHILRQAFKMLGENYGWGGLQEGRDCSSFIMDIYRVFGIWAPRNADQQEKVPGRHVALQGVAERSSRYALMERAEPGATLHMRNHVMMYLGQADGKHYAIHSLGSYGDSSNPRADGTLPRVEVMKVVVGGLDVALRSGRRFIDVLSSANVWHP